MANNKTPFLNASNAFDAYDESRKWFRPYFDPINEFERIARNKPSDRIDPTLPKVTDGTLAAIVQEQPKRIIQQVPTGIIDCMDYPEYAKIAGIVLFEELIPMYNRMGNMLQKSWNMVGKAMTNGMSSSYTFFTTTNGVLHTDFSVPYVKDVLGEKGKVFAPDSNIRFLRSWMQKRDIDAVVMRETALEKNVKGYKSDYNLKKLMEFAAGGASAKPADQMTPAEREKGGDTGGFEVIHAFQKGVGAEFYSFAPKFDSGKPFRTKVNKDPRGKIPIDDMYCNIDLSNPLGRGVVELSGGLQNLIDQQMQMFQFLTTLMMGPPMQVWGDVNTSKMKLRPNAIWKMGANPNNSMVKPYEVNNNAIANFPGNYGLLKSQILGLNSSQDHSISADAGNPTQSKTQAGVQASEARLGVSDNYLRKQFESWFSEQSETSTNIFFAEKTGTTKLKLKAEDIKTIMESPAKKYLKKNILEIPYSKISGVTFKFNVDASSSEIKEDSENAQKLTEVLKIIQASQDPKMLEKVPAVTKLIIDEIGAEGTDDLFPELKTTDENGLPVEGQQPQQADPMQMMQQIMPQIQQMTQQMIQEAMAQKPQVDPTLELIKALGVKFNDVPEESRHVVLEHIGLGSEELTPAAQNQALEVAKTAHSHTMEMHNAAKPDPAPAAPGSTAGGQSPKPATQPQQPAPAAQEQPQALDHPLTPEEQQIVQEMFKQGYNEQDVEQAIMLLRQGQDSQQVMQTIGAKYASAQ